MTTILLLIMLLLESHIIYISVRDKKQRVVSTLLLLITLIIMIIGIYYKLSINWLGEIWSNFINDLSDWWTDIYYWIALAVVICAVTYWICVFIAFICNKDKMNKNRDMALATLWLFWGIFGGIFWDIMKKFGECKLKETWLYLVFLLFFWLLIIYLSQSIKPQKTWSTTSQPTSPHDEENTTSSSQSSE